MKTLLLFCLICFVLNANAQFKEENTKTDFEKILELVENNRFKIKFTIATPLNGTNIQTDSAWVCIQADSASGYLPYYSPNYSFPRTGKNGILFDNRMLKQSMKIKGRKERKAIQYQFSVLGKNDNYTLKMDIQYDGTCYLYVVSKLRGPMSYIGTLSALSAQP